MGLTDEQRSQIRQRQDAALLIKELNLCHEKYYENSDGEFIKVYENKGNLDWPFYGVPHGYYKANGAAAVGKANLLFEVEIKRV